jgi:hypothetical protein
MAVITTYNTLVTAVTDYLARSDVSSGGWIPNFVQNWEERFYRDSQNWGSWMETALTGTVTSGVVAVPSDYLGLKVAYISGQQSAPLKRVSLDQLYQRYSRSGGTGTPRYIARNGANFEFGPVGADGLTIAGTYYAKPTVLRTDSDGINFLITHAPDLCLYGSLLEAEPFLKNDKRIGVWQQFYSEALMAYRSRFREEDYSGGPPHTVAV